MWESLNTDGRRDKAQITGEVRDKIRAGGFEIVEEDIAKPWGGYLRIHERNDPLFLDTFFRGVVLPDWASGLKHVPKILLVAPGKRLSWHYHDRRGEFWDVVRGPVGVYLSQNNDMPEEYKLHNTGETVEVPVSMRHRLVGTETWGIVAEIWVHVDPNNPSVEGDNHRVQDDFGRS